MLINLITLITLIDSIILNPVHSTILYCHWCAGLPILRMSSMVPLRLVFNLEVYIETRQYHLSFLSIIIATISECGPSA